MAGRKLSPKLQKFYLDRKKEFETKGTDIDIKNQYRHNLSANQTSNHQ